MRTDGSVPFHSWNTICARGLAHNASDRRRDFQLYAFYVSGEAWTFAGQNTNTCRRGGEFYCSVALASSSTVAKFPRPE